MKSKKVWLLSGIPGSGKSTWIQSQLHNYRDSWRSRDAVRFSLVNEDEEYFKREDEVFKTWIKLINDDLCNPSIENIYIDATHLNDKSRTKVLNQLSKENINEIINVVFDVPVNICLERNAKRDGRARVPEDVIKRMSRQFEYPKNYRTIIVNEKGECRNGKSVPDFRSSLWT